MHHVLLQEYLKWYITFCVELKRLPFPPVLCKSGLGELSNPRVFFSCSTFFQRVHPSASNMDIKHFSLVPDVQFVSRQTRSSSWRKAGELYTLQCTTANSDLLITAFKCFNFNHPFNLTENE